MTYVPNDASPPDRHELAPDLIDAYLAGRCTPVEWAQIDRWIGGDPARQAFLTGLRRGVTTPFQYPELPSADRTQAALRTLRGIPAGPRGRGSNIRTAGAALPGARWSLRRRAPLWGWLTGAAALVLLVGSGVLTRQHRTTSSPRPVRLYTTAVGEQATIVLPDSSRIQLAPASRLLVNDGYGVTTRTVSLSGEAYFDVRAANALPFVVRTGSVVTRVLGTTFGIRHYPADPNVRIAVTSGKVVSGGHRAPVTLTAGVIGFLTDSTTQTVVGDASAYTNWTQGRLTFEDAPVPVVLAAVGRWYGYEFHLKDSTLASRHLSVVFKTSAPTEMMLLTLKQVLDVTMTFDGTVVTLHPRRTSSRTPVPSRRERDTTFLPFTEVGR